MKASVVVCQLERSGGRSFVVLSKEREKEKERTKATSVEQGIPINEGGRAESRAQDGLGKCSKGHKRFPVNLTRVIDHLLEILLSCPFRGGQGNNTGYSSNMEVDDATTKMKGKTKVGEAVKIGPDNQKHSASGLNQSDYSQSGGIIHHILHHLLPLPADKICFGQMIGGGVSETVVFSRIEGMKVISELVKAVSSFSKSEGHSSISSLLPDKKVLAFVDLIYSIILKNSSSSSIPCSGCSPDISKSMIEGGVVKCLSSILEVVDLDHPEASKVVNLVLKSLESLTRAANEQVLIQLGL
ncbi:hypothetical protein Leryth_013766 [Lithospermum erythrorhizon]|nr:hypothetical protein Leryth_013766 [Lithospermum erythrorhizon]